MKRFLLSIIILFATSQVFAQQHPNTIGINKTFLGTVFKQRNVNLLPRDLLEIMKEHPAAYAEMQQAKKNYNAAMGLSLGGGALIAYPVSLYLGGGNPNWIFAAIGGGVAAASIPFAIKYNRQARSAATKFNESLPVVKKTGALDLKLQFGLNAVGMKLLF
ncbi:MAG: hypothetical protein ACXWEY_15525 [Bacteroidia bacterium]